MSQLMHILHIPSNLKGSITYFSKYLIMEDSIFMLHRVCDRPTLNICPIVMYEVYMYIHDGECCPYICHFVGTLRCIMMN